MLKTSTKLKVATIIAFVLIMGITLWLLFSGGNLKIILSVFTEDYTNEQIQEKLSTLGIRGYFTSIILCTLQVIFAFLPAEPAQVLSGIAFGFPLAFLCSLIGVFIGNSIIYAAYKIFGARLRNYFVTNLDLDFDHAATSPKTTVIILLLYILPAIPYGMICFLAASMGMKYCRFITVTVLGSIPSLILGVGLGHIAITSSFIISMIACGFLALLIAVLIIKRKAVFKIINEFIAKSQNRQKFTVAKYKPWKLFLPFVAMKTVFFFKRIKVNYKNNVGGKIEQPSIVLCNHGSFTDFVYAGTLLRKQSPNFIVARLYFYKSFVRRVLQHVGCFPKSMFTQDLESAKNCLHVIKNGGILAMMPEARLSTAGKFEDIQPGTFDFLKKAGVTVYTVKMSGDYFANPKWGKGFRKGAYVEAELDVLIDKDELSSLSVSDIESRVKERLYYDEFEWIEKHKDVKYKSRTIAEGLENILSICPKCKSKYTIKTKGHDVFCERCGKLASVDNRYLFNTGALFKHFGEWYEWQKACIAEEIASDPDYKLTSSVEFCLPSLDGKKLLRVAGYGVCTLDRTGLTYSGTKDGENTEIFIPIEKIYRLLFGAGENFEVYVGLDIHYFRPSEKRSCVDWYIASEIIYNQQNSLASAHLTC